LPLITEDPPTTEEEPSPELLLAGDLKVRALFSPIWSTEEKVGLKADDELTAAEGPLLPVGNGTGGLKDPPVNRGCVVVDYLEFS